MRTSILLAAIAALAFASSVDAKSCRDAKGHFVKCPAPAAAPAATPARPATSTATGGAPHCTKGKPCGHSCIAQDKVCHKG